MKFNYVCDAVFVVPWHPAEKAAERKKSSGKFTHCSLFVKPAIKMNRICIISFNFATHVSLAFGNRFVFCFASLLAYIFCWPRENFDCFCDCSETLRSDVSSIRRRRSGLDAGHSVIVGRPLALISRGHRSHPRPPARQPAIINQTQVPAEPVFWRLSSSAELKTSQCQAPFRKFGKRNNYSKPIFGCV